MTARELPIVDINTLTAHRSGNGRYGAAHARSRDAYKDVPILKKPTWTSEIAAYFFLGGVSSGAYVLAALAETTGKGQYRSLARTAHYVSFAAMAPCPALLIADLGKPQRFHYMLRIVKPSSPMNLGAWALTIHGAMATVAALRALADEGRLPLLGPLVSLVPRRAIAVVGLPAALTLGGYTGVLLGTSSIPVWFKSPLLGALFMGSAMSTGIAGVNLATTLSGNGMEARDALTRLGVLGGTAELALLGGYIATSGRSAAAYTKGAPALLMAGAVTGLAAGTALDIVGAGARSGSRALNAAAAAATLAGGALLRWAVVRAGHYSAQDREGTLEAMKPSHSAPGWGPHSKR